MPTDVRPTRLCDLCGKVDDHPRHQWGVGPDESPTDPTAAAAALASVAGDPDAAATLIAQIQDAATSYRHMDCCAAAGCPDGSCNRVHTETPGETPILGSKLEDGDGVLRGQDLIDFLESGAVDHVGTDLNNERVAAAGGFTETE